MAITTDDFNKIWASQSPLTPYEFSESNYKEGWNFIGGTPPSRQMWDFLQKNNDEKMRYLANNYLPLSGGTMTGPIYNNAGVIVRRPDDNGYTQINAGRDDSSSYIILYGKNSNGGIVNIRATDTINSSRMALLPNGTLKLNNDDVLTSANYNNYSLPLIGGTMSGTITSSISNAMVKSSNDDYILIAGGTDSSSAYLALSGKNRSGTYQGSFELRAKDGNNNRLLLGKPDGTLSWDGNNVMTNPIAGLGARQIRVYNNRQAGKFTLSEPSGSLGMCVIVAFISPTAQTMNRIFMCRGYWTGADRTSYYRIPFDIDNNTDGAFTVAVAQDSNSITFTVTAIGSIFGVATILAEIPENPVTFTWTPDE